jgi:hypothetical protein
MPARHAENDKRVKQSFRQTLLGKPSQLGGEESGLVAREVREWMLEDLERPRVHDRDFEARAFSRVMHAHAQRVVSGVPEKRYLEPVSAAMCELSASHGPIVPLWDNRPMTAS